ncbi:hypothetical protein GW17_00059306 [Ensete ventricosum]|nr:hypothetical protein GW17_00059306 [Ensete ventricosum]RZS05674.1 hypothetical protein BHM03_00036214 [Ensete ventricosum]
MASNEQFGDKIATTPPPPSLLDWTGFEQLRISASQETTREAPPRDSRAPQVSFDLQSPTPQPRRLSLIDLPLQSNPSYHRMVTETGERTVLPCRLTNGGETACHLRRRVINIPCNIKGVGRGLDAERHVAARFLSVAHVWAVRHCGTHVHSYE